MTANEFMALCAHHTITPDLALEYDEVKDALRDGKTVEEIDFILSRLF